MFLDTSIFFAFFLAICNALLDMSVAITFVFFKFFAIEIANAPEPVPISAMVNFVCFCFFQNEITFSTSNSDS